MSKSIITKYTNICLICGTTHNVEQHHLIEGTRRKLSDEDGLIVPLCSYHHREALLASVHLSTEMNTMSKIIGQLAWERNYCAEGHSVEEARQAFLERYSKSYI